MTSSRNVELLILVQSRLDTAVKKPDFRECVSIEKEME